MGTYRIHSQLYKGEYPVKVTVDGETIESNEEGEIIDPPDFVARLLEGMPEWQRTQGASPFGPKDVVADTLLRTRE